ncbi:MAG: hypothetical protein QM750_09250 [Rubrivivax sp.]
MPSPDDSPPARRQAPKRSLTIPALKAKIEYALGQLNRNHKWLTTVVISPHGSSPSASVIANWKNDGIVPLEYVSSLCTALGVDLETLRQQDWDVFRTKVDVALAPGSGRQWATLVAQAIELVDGLQLKIDRPREPGGQVGNLLYPGEGRAPGPAPVIPVVSLDRRVRFAIPHATADRILGGVGREASDRQAAFFCEDRDGWRVLMPHRQNERGLLRTAHGWLFPDAESWLRIGGPIGRFRALVVLTSAPIPEPVWIELKADRSFWPYDALAVWLGTESPGHAVLQREFLVTDAAAP